MKQSQRPSQYERMAKGQKTSATPARGDHAGAPSYPSPGSSVGGMRTTMGRGVGATVSVGRRPDEIDRSSIHTSTSSRTDRLPDAALAPRHVR